VFDESLKKRDFDGIEVPLAERGAPRLIRGDEEQTTVEAAAPAG